MKKCGICSRKSSGKFAVMCGECSASWMRSLHKKKDGSVLSCMIWAASRARRFFRKPKN